LGTNVQTLCVYTEMEVYKLLIITWLITWEGRRSIV